LEEKPRSGRPRKRTSTLARRLGQIKSRTPNKSAAYYAAELSKKGPDPVSEGTVRAALHDLGYGWRLPRRRRLTASQREKRIEFATSHLEDSWDRRVSADESTFNLYRSGNRQWVRVSEKDYEDEPSLRKLSDIHQKVSVSIIAAIGRGRKSELGFLPRGWDGEDLATVFKRDVFPSLHWSNRLGKQDELMFDNDGRHRQAAWLEYAEKARLRPLGDWPSNSPDLNPIENVFAWLKSYVEKLAPTDEQSLREAIQAAWRDIPLEVTETLMDSMKKRLEQCIAHRGGRTKY
jgi:transposase